MSKDWSVDLAKKVFGIDNYIREEFLTIDSDGHLAIVLNGYKIKLKELMDKYQLDVAYIRILPAIMKAMQMVHEAFQLASKALGFNGHLVPVFPMKVNSTPIVIESIMKFGEEHCWGFNTGSVGEVKLLQDVAIKYSPRTLIYDGVVTSNAIEELLKLYKIGWRVIVDIASLNEAETLSKYPQLEVGVRVKPIVKIHGKWSDSIGLGSKFGLTMNALVKLKEEFKWILERTTLLHMHPGSQVYKLYDLRNYFAEIREVYDGLKSMGFENITAVDPGGGVAYPYIDLRDGEEESPDYTVFDYFKELIGQFRDLNSPPNIIYEGGRFIVSSHRIVVAKVIDVRPYSGVHSSNYDQELIKGVKSVEDLNQLLDRLEHSLNKINFESSSINNKERELYENIVAVIQEDISSKILELIASGKANIEELIRDQRILRVLTAPTKRFILNMSIFADMPDTVLVGQYFQAVPVQRLNEQPHVLASLSDLTCDSMGEISLFISPGTMIRGGSPVFTAVDSKLVVAPGTKLRLRGIPLHIPNSNENYYVAFLDTGAYQDMLAMKHNLIYGAPEVIIDYDGQGVSVRLVIPRS